MIFKVGKYYKHSSGSMLHIVGGGRTTLYGWALFAEETESANLKPVGQYSDNTQNYIESTRDEWMKNFNKESK